MALFDFLAGADRERMHADRGRYHAGSEARSDRQDKGGADTVRRHRIRIQGPPHGKNLRSDVHSDPLGFLLYGHWTEQSMDADICLHSIVGEVQPRDTVMDGYVGKYWVGEMHFSTSRLYINLKSPKTKDRDSEPYRFNGEYSLVRD
jgi:hypothetical protein